MKINYLSLLNNINSVVYKKSAYKYNLHRLKIDCLLIIIKY